MQFQIPLSTVPGVSNTWAFLSGRKSLLMNFKEQAHTAFLFTKSDFKTIFFPVVSEQKNNSRVFNPRVAQVFFALAAARPLSSQAVTIRTCIWTWLHLLQANVANQSLGCAEDLVNKPWRPLPANRVSPSQARKLRWASCMICIISSLLLGGLPSSIALTVTTYIHDDLEWSKHWYGKTICNAFGYMSFESGATYVAGKYIV